MSRHAVDACQSNEKALAELMELLELQIKAARVGDMPTVQKLAEECDKLIATISRADFFKNNGRSDSNRKITILYRELECILADKAAVTQQQLRDIQQGQKLLGAYRP
jgi:hypothetical protein